MNLLPCPSCAYKHPKLVKVERRRKDMESKMWRDASEFSVKCPMCLMQAGPVEMNSEWPVKVWNTRLFHRDSVTEVEPEQAISCEGREENGK